MSILHVIDCEKLSYVKQIGKYRINLVFVSSRTLVGGHSHMSAHNALDWVKLSYMK